MRTEFELIQAFRGGDTDAADELIRRHLPRVRNLLFSLVLNNDAADDLTQDVFARVLQSLERYRGDCAFPTWLHRIAVNSAYDYLRAVGRNVPVELLIEPTDASGASPDQALIQSEGSDRVTAALGRLPPSLRTAIVLTAMQGMTAAEAAEIENCAAGTMYWRIHEARRRLRDDLKDWIE